jgi:group I intron endonuclease
MNQIKDEIVGGIYKIVNVINNKIYVGSAKNFKVRWNKHISSLKNNHHHNILLKRAFDKYGIDNLKFEIIEVISDFTILKQKEQYYLDTLYPFGDNGYNISVNSTGGDNLSQNPNRDVIVKNMSKIIKLTHKNRSEERKKEISFNLLGKKNPNWRGGTSKSTCICGQKMSNYAKKCRKCYSKEYIPYNKGIKYSEEECLKRSERTKGIRFIKSKRNVIIFNKKYEFISDASKELNLTYGNVLYRLKSKNYLYKDYYYEDKPKLEFVNKKIFEEKIFFAEGIKFNNLYEAYLELKIPTNKILRRIISKNFKNYYYI